VGVFDTGELEDDTFAPSAADHIEVSGGGPSGLLLDEKRNRLYVFTRFDNAIKIVDLASRTEVGSAPLFNPEPEKIKRGRRFLYHELGAR
jgi:DNA-binding beta-propeller fold protein YncE